MILKALIGLIIGIGFGLFNGAATFFLWRINHDPNFPGPMIPDDNGWRIIATIAAAVIAGACGALVGIIVSLSNVSRVRSGIVGFSIGAVILFLVTSNSGVGMRQRLQMLTDPAAIYLLLLPISSALLAIGVGVVMNRRNLDNCRWGTMIGTRWRVLY